MTCQTCAGPWVLCEGRSPWAPAQDRHLSSLPLWLLWRPCWMLVIRSRRLWILNKNKRVKKMNIWRKKDEMERTETAALEIKGAYIIHIWPYSLKHSTKLQFLQHLIQGGKKGNHYSSESRFTPHPALTLSSQCFHGQSAGGSWFRVEYAGRMYDAQMVILVW